MEEQQDSLIQFSSPALSEWNKTQGTEDQKAVTSKAVNNHDRAKIKDDSSCSDPSEALEEAQQAELDFGEENDGTTPAKIIAKGTSTTKAKRTIKSDISKGPRKRHQKALNSLKSSLEKLQMETLSLCQAANVYSSENIYLIAINSRARKENEWLRAQILALKQSSKN